LKEMTMSNTRIGLIGMLVAGLLAVAGCSSDTGTGAAVGAATGAGIGLLGPGSVLGNAAAGAALGGAGGYIYGQTKGNHHN
jgi:osmotically inducible lipoprotein OsmB